MPGSTLASCVVTGAAASDIDLTKLWEAHGAGAEGWPDVTRLTVALPARLAELAAEALKDANADPADTSVVIGSLSGTGHVAESIRWRLDTKGARWLDPEGFLHFTPHGVTASLCVRLGLAGYAATLLGPAAGLQAVAQAVRRIRVGGDRTVLCGAFEFLSPAAAARVGGGDTSTTGRAAFLVLDAEEETVRRAVRRRAAVRSIEVYSETPQRGSAAFAMPTDAASSIALADLVERLREPCSAGRDLVVESSAPGARYRCTLRMEGDRGSAW